MNEINIILQALQFLLAQHTNDVDPDKAVTAQRHLGNVKSIPLIHMAPPEPARPAGIEVASEPAAKSAANEAEKAPAKPAEPAAKTPAAAAPAPAK
jgi:hypothetical protein